MSQAANPGPFGSDIDVDEPVTDPLGLLGQWLAAANTPDHPLATLTTIGLDGYPNARNLLTSSYDGERIHFHSDTRSRKAAELAANPRATMAIVWPDVGRQVVITGDVAREGEVEAYLAFTERSRYLQLLAWVNDVDLAAQPTVVRQAAWSAYDQKEEVLKPPDTWVGFTLTPRRIAFWRADSDGPSNRVICERIGAGWSTSRRPG